MDWVGRVNIIIFVRDLDFKFGNLFRLRIFGIKDGVKTFLFYAYTKYLQD
jgi:hypothetical protein